MAVARVEQAMADQVVGETDIFCYRFLNGQFNWLAGICITRRCISSCGERSYKAGTPYTHISLTNVNELNSARGEGFHIISTMIFPF